MTADWTVEQISAGEDDISRYLQQIRCFPRLTAQQEKDLACRCAQGDEEAIREMVNCNLRLVVSVAREYTNRGVSMMDLVQEGSIGLLVAAKKFDPTLEYRFSTYATKWIRQGISRCLMNHGLIRVPAHTGEKIRKVVLAKNRLLQEKGSEPSMEEIAAVCDTTPEKVEALLQLEPQICSLDAPAGDEDSSLGTLLENLQAEQPFEALVREELSHIISVLMGTLNERQRQIVRLRYGMEDGATHSLEQIGQKLGISKERARQILAQAMEKLHKAGSAMGLEDFLE